MAEARLRIEYLADVPECLPTLAGWHHEEWSHLNPGDTVDRRMARMRLHLRRGTIPTTFAAFSGDVLLGSAALVMDDMHKQVNLSPWLASVFVAPPHRSRGVGTALVQRVVQEARNLDVSPLYLFTPDRESFYTRLGWSVVEYTRYMNEAVVIMALSLNKPKP